MIVFLRNLPIMRSLSVVLASLIIAMLFLGEVNLPISAFIEAIAHPASVSGEIVWGIRLPRNLTAALVGAMLGLSGAVMQGLLRNPLAEPGILGVSAGSGLGAAIAIVFGLGFVPFMVEGFSLLGAIIVAVILGLFIRRFPQRTALILVGVGLSSLCGALMALVFNLSPSPIAMAEIMNWMMGTVDNRQWSDVIVSAIVLAISVWGVMKYGFGLRLLTLGEDTAKSMGLELARFTQIMVGVSAILAGVSVAVAGIIGFVGLAAPHMVRGLGIKDPTKLLLPSALCGAIMVEIADAIVRLVPASGDIKLGVVTSLIGAPIFALLAYKSAKTWGSDI